MNIRFSETVALTAAEWQALQRAGYSTPSALIAHFRHTLLAEVARLSDKGSRGLTADAMIARGELEVGRAVRDNPRPRRPRLVK